MQHHDLPTASNHGGIIFPLEMFRASMLASALAEGLIAKVKNIVGAQLRLTRHATGPLVLARIEGDVVGDDAATFWEENIDLALYASQALPRECFAYYLADAPARKQGLIIAQRGQVVAGDQVTEDSMPPEATEQDWPLPRLCQQLGVTVAELAGGFEGGPFATVSLMEPSVADDETTLRTLAEQPAEAAPPPGATDDGAAPVAAPPPPHAAGGPTATPPPGAAAPGATAEASPPKPSAADDAKRRAREASEEASQRQAQAQALSNGLEVLMDDVGAVVICDAELADHDLLSPYLIKKVTGELPPGFDPALIDALLGKRVDFAVRVEFLSEVFIDDKPLSKPHFEAEATPLEAAVPDLRALEVLAPRLGRGTFIRRGTDGLFVSRRPDAPVPSALLERIFAS